MILVEHLPDTRFHATKAMHEFGNTELERRIKLFDYAGTSMIDSDGEKFKTQKDETEIVFPVYCWCLIREELVQ